MVTSSAVVGSSAISSFGSQASAMAIITRWRMPPESSWGYCFSRFSGSFTPTSWQHFQRPGVGLGPVAVGVEQDGFPQLIADGKGGVQARSWDPER